MTEAFGDKITNTANVNGDEPTAETTLIKQVNTTVQSSKVKPVNIVLVLDVSGSMNQNDDTKIKSLKSAAKQLKNQVFDNGEGSTISVITYSSSANFKDTYSDNTRDSRDFDRMIDNLWGNGGTDIYEALDETISVVNNRLKVNEETKNNETIVVFLTDGSPTIPDYISGVHSDDNTGDNWTYSNNTKSEIEQKAEELKATGVKEVYSIGLDLDGLSETNVRSASKCEIVKIDTNSVYDMNTHTFTITLTNPTDSSVTLDNVTAEFSDIEELVSVDNNGSILDMIIPLQHGT